MENIKKFKFEIEDIVDMFKKQVNSVESNCDHNHSMIKEHIDNIALKFAENTIDLTSAGEGYQREL